MPPGNIDMSAIQQALARRAGAPGAVAGGTTTPAQGQQSQPGGLTPTGNPNVPGMPMPQPMPMPMGGMPTPQGGQAPAPQQRPATPKMPASFDDETKNAGKVLITQLLKYL